MNIDIDETLMREAMMATGLAMKKATVEEALRLLVERKRQRNAIADLAVLGWEGDLDTMREGANPLPDRRGRAGPAAR